MIGLNKGKYVTTAIKKGNSTAVASSDETSDYITNYTVTDETLCDKTSSNKPL